MNSGPIKEVYVYRTIKFFLAPYEKPFFSKNDNGLPNKIVYIYILKSQIHPKC